MTRFKYKVCSNFEEDSFKQYREFLDNSGSLSVQMQLAWFISYSNAYLNNKNFFFLFIYSKETLIGIFPLQILNKRSTRFWNRRVWVFLGNGPTDFSAPLIEPGHEEEVAQAFFEYLKQNEKDWEEVRLAEMPKGNLFAQAFEELVRAGKYHVNAGEYSGFYEVDTTGSWDVFFESYIKPNNKDLLKDLRKLERQGMVLYVETIKENIYEKLEEVLHLYQKRRESLGQSNPYESPERRKFVELVTRAYEKEGKAELSLLKCEAEIWGFQLDWIDQETRYHWNHAYNEDYKKYSPGKILLYYLLEQSFNSMEIKCCNHMRGDAGYKSKLANRLTSYIQINLINQFSIRNKGEKWASKFISMKRSIFG